MSVAKVIELVGCSEAGFEEAVKEAVKTASLTIRGIRGVDVVRQTAVVKNNKIVEYRVTVKIAFGIEGK